MRSDLASFFHMGLAGLGILALMAWVVLIFVIATGRLNDRTVACSRCGYRAQPYEVLAHERDVHQLHQTPPGGAYQV